MSEPYWEPLAAAPASKAGEELAYAEFTASTNFTATTQAGANTLVTAPSITCDGVTPIEIEFGCPSLSHTAAGGSTILVLFDNGVDAGLMLNTKCINATSLEGRGNVSRRFVPTAGAHIFSIRAFTGAGTATAHAGPGGAGNYMPGFIRVTRV